MRLLPFLAFLLLFTAQSVVITDAMAKAPINDEGAAKVKAIVQKLLDKQIEMGTSNYSKVLTEGEINIEQAATYYAVTLPDITFISKHRNISKSKTNKENKTSITKIGIIGLNISPTDNPKEWNVTIAIPTPIKRLDKNKQLLIKIDIGQQQMAGIWNEDLNSFAKFDSKYSDLLISKENDNFQARISELTIKTSLNKSDNNLWSGPSNIQISDISFGNLTDGKYTKTAEVGAINITSRMENFSPYVQDKIKHIANSMKNITNSASIDSVTPILLPMMDIFDSTAFKVTLNNLKISPEANTITDTPFTLKEAFIGFGIHGLKERMLGKNLSFGWHGLSSMKEQQKNNNVIPTTASFSLSLDKLPLQPIIALIIKLSDNNKKQGYMAQTAIMNAVMTLPQELSKAGTNISIKDTMLKHPSYALNINGHLKASQDAILGANGEATIKTIGLNKAIKLLKKQRGDAKQEKIMKINSIIQKLETLQNLSIKDPNRKGLKTVKIILNNQGQTLINGVDMQEALATASAQ